MSIRTRLILIFGLLALLVVLSAAASAVTLFQVNRLGEQIFAAIIAAAGKSADATGTSLGQAVALGKLDFEDAVKHFGYRQAAIVGLALIMLGALSAYLQRNVLVRLERLRRFGSALAEGRNTLRIDLSGNDELTALARRLNAAMDHQSSLRAEMIGRLNQVKALTLALLGCQSGPSALVDLTGEILASTLDSATEDALARATEEIKSLSADTEATQEVDLGDGLRARFRPLRKGNARTMGWLVTA